MLLRPWHRAAALRRRWMCGTSCAALPETSPLPPELSTSPLLSPNAVPGSAAVLPSERYQALVDSGAIRADPHQRGVMARFDELHRSLPQYQTEMAEYAEKVKVWLRDWDEARDAVIRAKIEAARESQASFAQTRLVLPVARAVKQMSESKLAHKLPRALMASSALPELIAWANAQTDAQEGRLVVSEDEISEKLGRCFPAAPIGPAGIYLYGSVGTGKSLCMDIFFASTDGHTDQRRRVHFNAFMQEIQARMHQYGLSPHVRRGRVGETMRGASTGHTLTKAAAAVREKWEAEEAAAMPASELLLPDGVTIVGGEGEGRPKLLVQGRGIHDPFSAIAREILGSAAEHGGLLCFDELQVNDPFNAVAIREIFLRLIELGVVVVSTSNRELESLNRWRSTAGDETFWPLVQALSQKCAQLSLDGADYRRTEQPRPGAAEFGYIVGGNRNTLDKIFAKLREEISASCGDDEGHFTNASIPVMFGRTLQVPEGCWQGLGGRSRGVARFSFTQLCGANLGGSDYSGEWPCAQLSVIVFAALAERFSVVFIDEIPKMDFETRAYARRFITLIDELYNRRVRLVCSAADQIDELFTDVAQYDTSHDLENMAFETEMEENKSRFDLTKEASVAASNRSADNYTGEDEHFAFSRAASRLHEMQTERYWNANYM